MRVIETWRPSRSAVTASSAKRPSRSSVGRGCRWTAARGGGGATARGPGRTAGTARPAPTRPVACATPRSREAARLVDLVRRGDQADVAERLREVAELLAVRGVDLLREQAEVVGVAGELREQLLGPFDLAGLREAGDEPERADHEGPFLTGQPVGVQALLVAVAEHEPVLRQLARDRLDRPAHPLVGRRQEADDRH